MSMALKRRINLVLLLALSFSNIGFLIWVSFFTVHEILTQERFNLKQIAWSIDQIMEGVPCSDKQAVKNAETKIFKGLQFVRSSENISYRIFDHNGRTIINHNNCPLNKSSFNNIRKRDNYQFDWKSRWLEYWQFKLYYYGKNAEIAIMFHGKHKEVLESLFPFFISASLVILVITVLASMIIIRRILKSVGQITTAAEEVSKGNLSYRIPTSGTAHNDELEKLKLNLNKTFESLEESFHSISDFGSNVAHEIRTPLTILSGNLEVGLRHPRTGEEYQIIISEALDTIKELQHMVEDMLLMLRPAAAYGKNDFTTIDPGKILQDTVDQFELYIETKNINLECNIEKNLCINGIATLIRRIFFNIIDNAIKFSGKNATVVINLKSNNGRLEFTVTDNGPGITQEDISKVFDRFFRGQNSFKSHGLGLAMTRQLVFVHNGSISVSSKPGEETTFKVIL